MRRYSSTRATIAVVALTGMIGLIDCGGDDASPTGTGATGGTGGSGTTGGTAGAGKGGSSGSAGADAGTTGGAAGATGGAAGKGGSAGTAGKGGTGGTATGGAAGTGGGGAGKGGTAGTGGGMPDGSAGSSGGSIDASSDVPRTACTMDAQCSPPTPYCDTASRVCVQCLSATNCPATAPVCSAAKTCVDCATSADCSGTTPYCKPDTNTCVRCLSNANCGGDGGTACNVITNTCVTACTTDAQCTSNALPYCNAMLGYCVECLTSGNCAPDAGRGGGNMNQPVCLTTGNSFTCVACTDDTTCTTGVNTHCNAANNTCVRCMADSHCGDGGEICNLTTHTCGCPTGLNLCTTGGGRGGDGAVTSGCYNLQTDPTHCGGCTTVCNMNQTCTAGDCVNNDAGTTDTVTPPG